MIQQATLTRSATILPAALAFVLAGAIRGEGFTFPPEVRGDMTARLMVQVADAAQRGVVTLTVTVEGGENLEVEPARLDDPLDAWKATSASSSQKAGGRVVSSQ